MIQEQYVSFDTAKLLSEVGFDEPCYMRYYEAIHDYELGPDCGHTNTYWNELHKVDFGVQNYSAPTQAVAMRWFRELYHIEIRATYDYEKSSWWGQTNPMYDETDENSDLFQKLLCFDYQAQTYEEACEKAIQYAARKIFDYGYTETKE